MPLRKHLKTIFAIGKKCGEQQTADQSRSTSIPASWQGLLMLNKIHRSRRNTAAKMARRLRHHFPRALGCVLRQTPFPGPGEGVCFSGVLRLRETTGSSDAIRQNPVLPQECFHTRTQRTTRHDQQHAKCSKHSKPPCSASKTMCNSQEHSCGSTGFCRMASEDPVISRSLKTPEKQTPSPGPGKGFASRHSLGALGKWYPEIGGNRLVPFSLPRAQEHLFCHPNMLPKPYKLPS